MKRRLQWWIFSTVIVLIIGEALLIASPELRTRAYLGFCRTWHAHWPMDAGRKLPDGLYRAFSPFVPLWEHIEPGVTMQLDPYDMVAQHILMDRTWEPETVRELSAHMPPGGTFVDVGAHIGWYALKLAKVVGPKGHVIAVEPNHETLSVLRADIGASGAGGVISVAPVACSDSETTLTFYAAPRENTGESSLAKRNASQGGAIAASYPVRARRLDDIVREAGVDRVDAIKIDVEGAEFLVLKGASATLDRFRPVISVELDEEQLISMGTNVAEVMAFLRAHGYAPKQTLEENTIFLPEAPR